MAQVAAMSKYALPEQLFGEADLENEEVSLAASRCSYPPPDVSGELSIDAQLAAELTGAEDAHTRKTEPDPHTRQTAPTPAAPERESAPHSIEDAVLRALEGAPAKRQLPRA